MTRNGNPKELAPSIDAQWRDAFVVELRLQGASGATIADALVEVETHCRESGEIVAEAFGPPVEYAEALDLPDESRSTPGQLVRTWVGLLLVVVGFWLATGGGAALLQGQDAEVTVGDLVSFGLTLVLMVLLFVFGDSVLRLVVDHIVWAVVLFVAALAVAVVSGLPFDDIRLGSVAAMVPLIVGLAVLVAGLVLLAVWNRTGKSLEDPLVPPNEPNSRNS